MIANNKLPEIITIPNRLCSSKLKNGWREFFCYISFSPNQEITIDHMTWKFLLPEKKNSIVSGNHAVTKQEMETGRVVLSTLLPPEWGGGELSLEASPRQGTCLYHWQVENYRQSSRFRLPLDGQVLIFGGHRVGEVHRAAWQIASQQMGWDMLNLDLNGLRLLKGELSQNLKTEDFFAFGHNVLAPAAGEVIKSVDGNIDLVYGEEHPQNINYYLEDLTRACGNYVIINHGNEVWSCLAHLRNGSVRVKTGDEIKVGQIIGELGNSGNSTGPHLHIHFMDGPDLLKASPLPIEFDMEGETYAPQSGEIVSN
jgi:hypothetical protein